MDIVTRLHQGAEVEECLLEDIPTDVLLESIECLARGIARVDKFRALLQYAIGCAMTKAARDPQFLTVAGFENFGKYEAHLIRTTGMGHTTLWKWKPIFETLPELTREQLTTIPAKSIYLIAKNVQPRAHKAMLEVAATMTIENFKTHAEGAGVLGKPITGGANFILGAERDVIRQIRDFVDHPKVREYVGSENAAEIILAALHETQSSGQPTGWPIL